MCWAWAGSVSICFFVLLDILLLVVVRLETARLEVFDFLGMPSSDHYDI
jgi:hypothetical protein